LRIELAGCLPIRAIARKLSQAAGAGRFAQLQIEVGLPAFGVVHRLFRQLKSEHLDFHGPGALDERG